MEHFLWIKESWLVSDSHVLMVSILLLPSSFLLKHMGSLPIYSFVTMNFFKKEMNKIHLHVFAYLFM